MHAYGYPDSRIRAYSAIALLSVLAAVVANALANHLQLGPSWLVSAPTVGASFGILYGVVERWGWQWRIVRSIGLSQTPMVGGVYVGTLRSVWQGGTELPIKVEIDQTWSRIVIRFEVTGSAGTSSSISLAAALRDTGLRHVNLTYVYRNTIRPGFAAPDMSDHDGTAELSFDATDVVSGKYYNYRGRQGTLSLRRL